MSEQIEMDMEDEIEIIQEDDSDQVVEEVNEAPEDERVEDSPVDAAPEAEASGESQESDELADYSESVQRRIRKLTAKYREEERQRAAALEYAEAVKKQNEELQQALQDREASYVGEMGGRIEREIESAKVFLKNALDEGDADQIFEAQRRISDLTLQQAQHADATRRVERQQEQQVQAPEIPAQQYEQPTQTAQPDPQAQDWAEKNPWFGQDESMTYAAFGIHRKLVEEEGFDPTSQEYYNEIDRRIRADFPQKFADSTPKSSKPRVASAESTASKTNNKGRRTVKLTPSQVAIAKKLGVPLEEYAKYVKE